MNRIDTGGLRANVMRESQTVVRTGSWTMYEVVLEGFAISSFDLCLCGKCSEPEKIRLRQGVFPTDEEIARAEAMPMGLPPHSKVKIQNLSDLIRTLGFMQESAEMAVATDLNDIARTAGKVMNRLKELGRVEDALRIVELVARQAA